MVIKKGKSRFYDIGENVSASHGYESRAVSQIIWVLWCTWLNLCVRILIVGQFMEVLNVTAIQLPTLRVDGVTGEYTCLVCENQGTPQEVCVNSTIPIEGERM